MAISTVSPHCETCVQHQNTSFCPGDKESPFVGRRLKRRIVILNRSVDIDKRWWSRCRRADREAKSVRLIVIVVWILTDYDCLDTVKRR